MEIDRNNKRKKGRGKEINKHKKKKMTDEQKKNEQQRKKKIERKMRMR